MITDKITTTRIKSNGQFLPIPLGQDKKCSITAIADENNKSSWYLANFLPFM
ncbi:MAG: hypothetical protein ACR2LL_08020 [Nitrosopumilus sp.]